MNNESEIQNQQDDEISLLDLFTVLLRYRKLIISITLFSVVLAVAGYFIYPAYQYNKARRDNQFQGKAFFSVNNHVQPLVTQNLGSLINDADIVYDSLRDAGMEIFNYGRKQKISLADEAERSRALFLINELLVKGVDLKGKVIPEKSRMLKINSVNGNNTANSRTVEISFKNEDIVLVNSFIQAMFIRSNETILSYIRSDAEAIVRNFELLMNNADGIQYTQQILAENFNQYSFFKNVFEGRENVLLQSNAVITENMITLEALQDAYAFKGVILGFTGFLMALMLAFLLNVIRITKSDEKAMKKIREAMGNSGGK